MTNTDFMEKAFEVFLRYGFKKTSMDDVANAVGLSRQAIYKRYGSKEKLFDAVVNGVVQQAFENAYDVMLDKSLPIDERFIKCCNCYAGEYVEALRSSPHSAEVIIMANHQMGEHVDKLRGEFEENCVKILLTEGVFEDATAAYNAVFVIEAASKGLLHTSKTQQDYLSGMRTVVQTVLPT